MKDRVDLTVGVHEELSGSLVWEVQHEQLIVCKGLALVTLEVVVYAAKSLDRSVAPAYAHLGQGATKVTASQDADVHQLLVAQLQLLQQGV